MGATEETERRTPAMPRSLTSVEVRMNGGRLSSSSKSSNLDLYSPWPCGAAPRDGCGETAVDGSDGEEDIDVSSSIARRRALVVF